MSSDLLEYRRGRGAGNTDRPLTQPVRVTERRAVMQPSNTPEEWRPIASLIANTTQDGECLRWSGSHNPKGYGYVSVDGVSRSVHRHVYELVVGPIPDGLEIDHVAARGCRHRDCINPGHLEAVTHAENVRRSNAHAGINHRKTQCPRGHVLGGGNLSNRADGKRECLTCRKEHDAARSSCHVCGTTILRKNMSRHVRNKHTAGPVSAIEGVAS